MTLFEFEEGDIVTLEGSRRMKYEVVRKLVDIENGGRYYYVKDTTNLGMLLIEADELERDFGYGE